METRIRQIGPDVVRIIAFAAVPAIHFFLNTEYYITPVKGVRMYFMTVVLVMCSICVPLFMILTGFLMSSKNVPIYKKELLRFYSKLRDIITTYVLTTIFILLYRCIVNQERIGIRGAVMNLLGYHQYSWYVNMYIGCFLLIPFLNLLWNSLSSQESRRILVIVLLVLTALPSVLNVYDLETPGALRNPWLTGNYAKFVPDWWAELYPLTYYYIGAYIRCYVKRENFDRRKLKLALLISFFAFGGYDFWRSYSEDFKWALWCDWGSLQNTLISVMVFILLISADYSRCSATVGKVLRRIAPLTFGAYLLSWVPDHFLYPQLIEWVPNVYYRFHWYVPSVLFSIMSSLLLAQIIQWIQKILYTFIRQVWKRIEFDI